MITKRRNGRKSWRRDSLLLLSSFLFGVAVAMLTGCTSPKQGQGFRMPWTNVPDQAEGVVPPYERVEELENLKKTGPKASAQVQQEVSARLANEYQKEEDPIIRSQIIKTLGAYPTESAAFVLRHALGDSDPEVRIVACEAWGQRSDQEAVQRLGERVNSDTDNNVRLAALRALGETGRTDAVRGIAPALEDSDPALQRRAVLAMKEVSDEDFGNDVVRWQQWANNKPIEEPKEMSLAERLQNLF